MARLKYLPTGEALAIFVLRLSFNYQNGYCGSVGLYYNFIIKLEIGCG